MVGMASGMEYRSARPSAVSVRKEAGREARTPTFAHDARVAATMLLPLCILFDFAGSLLRNLAAFGLLCGYLLHALGWKETCFVASWLIVLIEAIGQVACSFSAFSLS